MSEDPQEKPRRRGPGRPFQKGRSGNPNGRPKKQNSLTELLRKEIRKTCPEDRQGRTYEELIVQATIRLAIKGNAPALHLVWDRLDGKLAGAQETEATRELILRVAYAEKPTPAANRLPGNSDPPSNHQDHVDKFSRSD